MQEIETPLVEALKKFVRLGGEAVVQMLETDSDYITTQGFAQLIGTFTTVSLVLEMDKQLRQLPICQQLESQRKAVQYLLEEFREV